jgi:hypothetical protein
MLVIDNDSNSSAGGDAMPSEAPRGKWQFSIRSLIALTTVTAIFLSVSMSVPGLKELWLVVLAIAVPTLLCFALGVLVGWLSERKS